jgi:predicted polyphosphate/ATP-dependent NAD kinase
MTANRVLATAEGKQIVVVGLDEMASFQFKITLPPSGVSIKGGLNQIVGQGNRKAHNTE